MRPVRRTDLGSPSPRSGRESIRRYQTAARHTLQGRLRFTKSPAFCGASKAAGTRFLRAFTADYRMRYRASRK